MVRFYNSQRLAYHTKTDPCVVPAKDSVVYDPSRITWTDKFLKDLEDNVEYRFDEHKVFEALYRPFTKMQMCCERRFIQRMARQGNLFPKAEKGVHRFASCREKGARDELPDNNMVIAVPGKCDRRDFCALMIDQVADLNIFDGGTQCFPLYWYEEERTEVLDMFEEQESSYTRHDGITDYVLFESRQRFGPEIAKEDIFFYVYGLLHSPEYRRDFSSDLKKLTPRILLVSSEDEFYAFSNAGRRLAHVHINYESQKPPKFVLLNGQEVCRADFSDDQLEVTKMVFAAKGQKDRIVYNSHITISGIPAFAYDYVLNNKSAIEWIMERYSVVTHKDSGIVNNPNAWGIELGSPRYVLDLILSIISVSIETMEIVHGLPRVRWE